MRKFIQKIKIGWNIFLNGYEIPESADETGLGTVQDLHEGFVHRNKKYTPYTALPRKHTALTGLHRRQFFVLLTIAIVLGIACFINWKFVAVGFLGVLTFIYFFDLFFNLFLIIRSFSKSPEIKISDEELENGVPAGGWPSYTIFCPLYKEWQVLPQFTEAISNLDYPQEKVQVLLLLEQNDTETVEHARGMELPKNFEIVVVPHGMPKTKPKAMNYGLLHTKGEYLVVYDAEDKPESSQLKKAVLAFGKSDESTVCIQAKLNFYNPNQNLLTRIFTAEYSLWFDLVLPGLQSIKAPIPLGGTSNHFKTEMVRKLQGWDPFNVTEDCDLGLRLAKQGFHTAIVDSTTYEEANSDTLNWYNQRSRWIKGYMQTYLVHMRHPLELWHGVKKPNLLYFQLTVGAKILSLFVNPIFWLVTILYFAFRAVLGPKIETFFPPAILYMGVTCLIFGNFLYLYYYMIGLAKRKLDGLIIFSFTVPLYWIGMSVAAWKAFYELIFKPHYWSKTVHGLHLQQLPGVEPIAIPQTRAITALALDHGLVQMAEVSNRELVEEKNTVQSWKQKFRSAYAQFRASKGMQQGAVLTVINVVVNFLNLVLSVFLGRKLDLAAFGTFVFLSTSLSIVQIFAQTLSGTIKRFVGEFYAKQEVPRAVRFAKQSVWTGLTMSLFIAGIFIAGLPFISNRFQLSQTFLVLFLLSIPFSFYSGIWQGFMGGVWKFSATGVNSLIETLVKIAAAAVFVYSGTPEYVALAFPISLFALSILARLSARGNIKAEVEIQKEVPFPAKYFFMSVLSGIGMTAFLNVDVLLAKYYLSPEQAGLYGILSFAGKMIFFAGTLLNFPLSNLVANLEAGDRKARRQIQLLFVAIGGAAFSAWVVFGAMGAFTIPFIFGAKAKELSGLFSLYGLGTALFTLASTMIGYHIARRRYWFWVIPFLSIALTVVLVVFRHASVHQIVQGFFVGALVDFVGSFVGTMVVSYNRFILRAFVDLVDLFRDKKYLETPDLAPGKLKVLVFNWRDINHSFAGGAEVYVHELSKRWVSDGHQVTFFSGNDGEQLSEEVIDGVHVIRRGGFYLVYFWAFVYYVTRFRGKFDVILDCHNGVPFFTPFYARERVVCLLHHVHQEVFRQYLPWYLAIFASFMEKTAMSFVYRYNDFITVSKSSQKEMENLGLKCRSISVVHPGVDLVSLVPGVKHADPLVLYVGRLKGYKSVDVLIRAYKKILETVPKAKLVVAGGGEEMGNLKALTKELDLQGRIEFTGKISEKDKLSWMQRAWVFVIPSMMEGWGITAIEANACGVPVVASNVPGLRESVSNPHTGYLVPHGDHEKFAERISYLLTDHKQRKWMEKEALAWSKQFDWEKSAGRALEVISHRREIP